MYTYINVCIQAFLSKTISQRGSKTYVDSTVINNYYNQQERARICGRACSGVSSCLRVYEARAGVLLCMSRIDGRAGVRVPVVACVCVCAWALMRV